jgi:hypothetical protein
MGVVRENTQGWNAFYDQREMTLFYAAYAKNR